MGLVLRRTSRKRRSMAFVVLTCLRSASVLYRKHVNSSSRSFRRHATAFGYVFFHLSAKRRAALSAVGRLAAFMILCRSCLTRSRCGLRTLSRTFLTLCAQQRWTAMPG